MNPEPATAVLDEAWRDALARVAQAERFPGFEDTARAGALVARLSAVYNDRADGTAARPATSDDRDALAARLLFSFARDVPKAAAAVRELVAAGLLGSSPSFRLLDLGAGLGAMTFGVARAISAGRPGVTVEADLVDRHGPALALAEKIAAAAPRGEGEPAVRVHVKAVDASAWTARSVRYDLAIAGQVLSELDRELDEDARVVRHADMIARWFEAVTDHGSLVIVEPALRDRTRHLHRLRAELIARKVGNVFAPCLHESACPMLARETDWCHEDLLIDLPEWLVPIARAAGLRYEGLTFSYLVLRKDGASLRRLNPGPSVLRDVSGLARSKGKTERMLCGVTAGCAEGGGVRAMRLDREASDANTAWTEAQRGSVLTFDPPLSAEKPRVRPEFKVTVR